MADRHDDDGGVNVVLHGLPGHPLHPPVTDLVIGSYGFATLAATADVLEVSDNAATHGWWLAIFAGLLFTVPAAGTGLADWLRIPSGTPLWRTATSHMIAMLVASAVFLATLLVGKESFDEGNISAGPYVLTLIGFGILSLGGFLGGSIVFVHGMRVLNLVDLPARQAATPMPTPQKEEAEGS
jgi:uncharacterized membrane protein